MHKPLHLLGFKFGEFDKCRVSYMLDREMDTGSAICTLIPTYRYSKCSVLYLTL